MSEHGPTIKETERLIFKILAHQENRPLCFDDFVSRMSYIRRIFLPSDTDLEFALRKLIRDDRLTVTIEVRGPGWEVHRENCVSIKSPLDLLAEEVALQEGWK